MDTNYPLISLNMLARDEFDIVFSPGEVNRSPVVSVEHKLGLESWCMKHVYAHAHAHILKARRVKRIQGKSSLLASVA